MPIESSREVILARIRAANGERGGSSTRMEEWAAVPRGYRVAEARGRGETIALFVDRLRDYDAHATSTTRAGLKEAIADRLRERGGPRLVVPRGLPAGMLRGWTATRDLGAMPKQTFREWWEERERHAD